jgi:L-ascorbate metabolism protein UlaG (beta-lactamase superfamily)
MLRLTYHGHAAFSLTDGKQSIIIDPFLDGNPVATVKPSDIRVDYIIVTHAHGDHLGDAIPIAKQCKATIIANNEIAEYVKGKGALAHNMHIGGTVKLPFGWVKLTIAHHGSVTPDGVYGGNPAGALVNIGGKTVYHTGDTALFYDMKLIGEMNPVDVMLCPIGDNYTMGITDAAKAVEFVKPKLALPMHYNTWPVIAANPDEFIQRVAKMGMKGKVLQFGESLEM